MTLRKIKGLILTGGKSSRMGTPKALIHYHGKPHARYLYDLLNNYCEEVYLSCQKDQWKNSAIADLPQLIDLEISEGPTRAIMTALLSDSTVDWLVVACDLIHVSDDTIKTLIENRRDDVAAICFANREQHFPEALCAIYIPEALDVFQSAIAQGTRCPVKILNQTNILKLQQNENIDLAKINTPEDLHIHRPRVIKKVHVKYFAMLRDHAGKSSETLESDCQSYRELYQYLSQCYQFSLPDLQIRVAVDDAFTSIDSQLVDGAHVVFIPPVAGG